MRKSQCNVVRQDLDWNLEGKQNGGRQNQSPGGAEIVSQSWETARTTARDGKGRRTTVATLCQDISQRWQRSENNCGNPMSGQQPEMAKVGEQLAALCQDNSQRWQMAENNWRPYVRTTARDGKWRRTTGGPMPRQQSEMAKVGEQLTTLCSRGTKKD